MKKSLAVLALVAFTFLATPSTALAQDTVQLDTTLSGANEVGDPGDPDGSGTASLKVDAANTQICFEFSVAAIDPVTGGHIHTGGAGANGDVVVDFSLDATATAGCVNSDTAMIASILNTPELFYVNVHTEAFPGGAIRGQLMAIVDAVEDTAAAADDSATAATTAEATTTEELAFTGDVTGMLAMAGAALVATGAIAVITSRRKN